MSQPAKKPAADQSHEEEELGKAYDGKLMLRLWPFVRPYRRQVWATILLFVPIFVLELAPAWVVKVGMDLVLPAATAPAREPAHAPLATTPVVIAGLPTDSISHGLLGDGLLRLQHRLASPPPGIPVAAWLACIYFSVSVTLGLLSWLHQVIMATTGQYAMFDLRRAVFDHIERLHMSFFDAMPVGRLVTRATNDVENLGEMFSQGLVALVTDVIKMLGFAFVQIGPECCRLARLPPHILAHEAACALHHAAISAWVANQQLPLALACWITRSSTGMRLRWPM